MKGMTGLLTLVVYICSLVYTVLMSTANNNKPCDRQRYYIVNVILILSLSQLYFTWHGSRKLWAATVFHQLVLTAIFPASPCGCFTVTVPASDRAINTSG